MKSQTLPTTIEEAYESVQVYIHRMAASRDRKRCGWDYDEFVSVAHEVFVSAWGRYDPDKGMTFDRYFRYLLCGADMEFHRNHRVRKESMAKRGIHGVVSLYSSKARGAMIRPRFDVMRFIADLSEDARVLVESVLDLESTDKRLDNHSDRNAYPKAVRRLLNAGWSSDRITQSYIEVSAALETK